MPVISPRTSIEERAFVAAVLQATRAAVVIPRFSAVSSSSPPTSEISTVTSLFRESRNRWWTQAPFSSQPVQTPVAACSSPCFTAPGLGSSASRRAAWAVSASRVGSAASAFVPTSSTSASVGTVGTVGTVGPARRTATNATAFGSYSAAKRLATSSSFTVGSTLRRRSSLWLGDVMGSPEATLPFRRRTSDDAGAVASVSTSRSTDESRSRFASSTSRAEKPNLRARWRSVATSSRAAFHRPAAGRAATCHRCIRRPSSPESARAETRLVPPRETLSSMRRLNAASPSASRRSSRQASTVVVGGRAGESRVTRTSSESTSGSAATTAKLVSGAAMPDACGAGRGRLGAPPNASRIAFTTSAGSASATTSTVALDAVYHVP